MKKINKIKKRNITEIALLILLFFLVAIVSGLYQAKNANFNPINGSFQNYNVVRRLLSGQIPFKDFAVYLGLGHLYSLSFFQLIIGNNFYLSLFISNMVTMLFFELFIFTIGYLIFKSKVKALYISILLSSIILINPPILANLLPSDFLNSIKYFVLNVGNSARIIRSACIYIFPLIYIVIIKLLNKLNMSFIKKNINVLRKIMYAFLAGISILWSNDAGIATFLAFSLVYFILLIKEYKKNIKAWLIYIYIYIISAFLGFLICLLLVTRGHIISWFKYTLGVSSYQMWYFGAASEKTNISIFDLDLNINIIILLVFAFYFVYKLIKEKNFNLKYIFLSTICLATYISSFMYQWLSGGINRNLIDVLLLIICFCYILYWFFNNITLNKNILILKLLIFFFTSCSLLQVGFAAYKNFHVNNDDNAKYLKNLGGYLTSLGTDIEDATKLLNGEKVFSLYASALEANSNNYQPSGYDYIIHVLGDENRKTYINSFKNANFKYVATTDRDFISCRYWIRNSNWFFYKELYKDYKPIYANTYNLFWVKDKVDDLNLESSLQLNKISENKTQIIVTVDDNNFNGIASVKLNYNAVFKEKVWTKFDINKYVYVDDITVNSITNLDYVNYNIPNKSEEYYVPITIINGVGEIILSSYPVDNSELAVFSAKVDDLFDTNFKYGVFANIDSGDKNILYAEKTKENEIIFKDAKYLKIGYNKTKVLEISENENYLIIKIEDDKNIFTYPNVFEIIK